MEKEAAGIFTWLQAACADLACGDEGEADRYYNDADVISDLLGDRIHDEAHGDRDLMVIIADDLRKSGHPIVVNVCTELIGTLSE